MVIYYKAMIAYPVLIQSWLEYLRLEELSNLKIKKSSVENFRLYKLNFQGSVVTSSNCIIKLTFHNKELLKHLADSRDKKSESFYLLFPVIEETRTTESFYYPLFIIPFSEEIINFLKLDINYSNPDTQSNKKAHSDDKQEIKWFEREIHLDKTSEFMICKPVFTEILKMDPIDYESLTHGKSLITILRELLNLPDDVSFTDAFNEFKHWCKTRLEIFGSSRRYRVAPFDFILLDGDLEIFQNEKIKKQLSILKEPTFDPVLNTDSIAHEYLYGKQRFSFDEYNKPNGSVWYGTFHNFPLSYGQALVLQKYSSGDKLIAVQGPPGTGKTTLLMAVLAQTMVQRAISIAEKEVDYPTVILVTSTANKAVKNTAREFENNESLKRFSLYKYGGFYFSYVGGQTSGDFAQSISNLERLKKQIDDEDVSQASEKYKKTKSRLLSLYTRLNSRFSQIIRLKSEYNSVLSKIHSIESQHPNIDKQINTLNNKIQQLMFTFNHKYDYVLPETVEEIKHILDAHSQWLENFNKSRFCKFNYQELINFTESNIEKDASLCYIYFYNRSIIDKIINLFTHKEQKMISQFITTYMNYLEKLGFSQNELYNRKVFPETIKSILDLYKESLKWKDSLPDSKLFMFPELSTLLKDHIELVKSFNALLGVKQELEELYSLKSSIEKHYLFPYTESSEKIFDLWRTKHYLRTRALFNLAMEFLYLYAVMNKNKVVKYLELFIQLFSSDSYRAREEIKKEGVKEFYRIISLVCPVYFSSLNSSPFIFDKFIYANGDYAGLQNEFLSMKFKPIHLLFIDEAGMALPHLVYPAIFWSEKAICVGDPMQLQPVVCLDENTKDAYHTKFYPRDYASANRFSPALISAYHRAARCETGNPEPTNIGQACFLDYHRRCQPPIAKLFCKVVGYKDLFIATPSLTGKDKERLDNIGGKHLIFYDIHGIKGNQKNTNYAEALAIKAICNKLQKAGYDIASDVGIITPYVNQEWLIRKVLGDLIPESHIGTVHKFQGSEYPVIIMSTVVFEKNDSVSFIDGSPNLLNVAISRAKQLFILVGSASKLKTQTRYFAKALDYIKLHGLFIEGVEFDETDERRKNKKALTDLITQNDQEVTLLSDAFEHMAYFKQLVDKANNSVLIVSPWIKAHNMKQFSYEVLKELNKKGVKVYIVYGYSQNEELDSEVKTMLDHLTNIRLVRMPNLTHAKILAVDDTEVVVSSFNWLSHLYYKYSQESLESKALIRNEIGLLTKNRMVINKILSLFRFTENETVN